MPNDIDDEDQKVLDQMKKDKENADGFLSFESEYERQFQAHVEGVYQRLQDEDGNVSIQTLLDRGITPDMFQSLCDENPQMIQCIGGGPTCDSLARAADQKASTAGRMEGKCLAGVKDIYQRAQVDSLQYGNSATNLYRQQRSYQGTSNGGSSGYVALENSGDFISVSIPNQAYGTSNRRYTDQDNNMNGLVSGLRPGVTITIDDILDQNMRQTKGDTPGGRWGHIAVSTSRDGEFCCDGRQQSFNFPRYGENVHICFPKDACVDKNIAMQLIAMRDRDTFRMAITPLVEVPCPTNVVNPQNETIISPLQRGNSR